MQSKQVPCKLDGVGATTPGASRALHYINQNRTTLHQAQGWLAGSFAQTTSRVQKAQGARSFAASTSLCLSVWRQDLATRMSCSPNHLLEL